MLKDCFPKRIATLQGAIAITPAPPFTRWSKSSSTETANEFKSGRGRALPGKSFEPPDEESDVRKTDGGIHKTVDHV